MAVIRQQNWLGQQRVDLPHLRSLESAISNDFDILGGKMLSGGSPLVLRGLTLSTSGTIGQPAENLQLIVENALVLHESASEAGTIFSVPAGTAAETLSATNSKVTGSFVASTTNYIGIDLLRSADSSTSDLVSFLDISTGLETQQTVPLARILNYQIVISTQNFTVNSNILPIAKVVTSATNLVVSITDARRMMFRLGSGGDNPQAQATYPWSLTRTENTIVYTGGADAFVGEDKNISNLKSWMDAMMTSLWELRGGASWYSATNRDNVKILYGQPKIAATQDNFDWNLGTETLTWRGLQIAFENSPASYNIISHAANPASAVIPDGSCLYVDLQRELPDGTIVYPAVADLNTLGGSVIPGRRFIIAWRIGSLVYTRDRAYEVGVSFAVASTTVLGIVKLSRAASTPLAPIVISDQGGAITAAAASNDTGLTVTGNGTGAGIHGISGATDDGYGLYGSGAGAATNGYGVGGVGKGNKPGVWGTTNDAGILGGVYGSSTAAGGNYGVRGDGSSIYAGVYGVGSVTDQSIGVHGVITAGGGTNGTGVVGEGKGANPGVFGFSGATNGAVGVLGQSAAAIGHGVKGIGSGTGYGIYGKGGGAGFGDTTTDSVGVYGTGGNGTTSSIAVFGDGANSNSTVSIGVKGTGKGGANGYGVYGISGSTGTGTGVYGESIAVDGVGVKGKGTGAGSGVYGQSQADGTAGVYGTSLATNGHGVTGNGTGTGIGVKASNLSGTGYSLEVGDNHAHFIGGNSATTVPITNVLRPDNIVKTWFRFNWNLGSYTVSDGVNISSATGGANGEVTITLAGGGATGDVCMVATPSSHGIWACRQVSNLVIHVFNTISGADIDMTATTGYINVIMMYKQA